MFCRELGSHKSHPTELRLTVARSDRLTLTTAQSNNTQQLQRFTSAARSLAAACDTLESSAHAARTAIKQHIAAQMALVQAREQQLLKEVDGVVKYNADLLMAQRKECAAMIAKLVVSVNEARRLSAQNDVALFEQKQSTLKLLNSYVCVCVCVCVWV
jgi:hypothetical protein